MRGLDPRIHDFPISKQDMDARVKPGHDVDSHRSAACWCMPNGTVGRKVTAAPAKRTVCMPS
jgi:hypothetical protein